MLYLSFILIAVAIITGILGFIASAGLATAKILFGIIMALLALSMAYHLLRNT